MTLDSEVLDKLRRLLKDTTALVLADDEPYGTAFFISDELLLTCAHVAPEGSAITIQPYRHDNCRPAEVTYGSGDTDLALLHCPLNGDTASPCVVLGGALDDGTRRYLVAGYPGQACRAPGCQSLEHTASSLQGMHGEDLGLEFDPDKRIMPGWSGSPTVSTETGTVTAIIQSVFGAPETAPGGEAVPVSVAAREFPEVADLLSDPETEPGTVKWRDALGPVNWQLRGKRWHVGKCVDLHIHGGRQEWVVGTDPPPANGHTRRGPDLGLESAEAIFSWAQGRHASGLEEVKLLGHLLGNALLPVPLQEQMDRLGRADEVLVRLHVAADSMLADIPWELASVRHPDDQPLAAADKNRLFIAADPRYQFVRVTDEAVGHCDPVVPESPHDITVLTVVAQPADRPIPQSLGTGQRSARPDEAGAQEDRRKATRERLRKAIASGNFSTCPPMPAQARTANDQRRRARPASRTPLRTYAEVKDALQAATDKRAHYDVVHFMGTGMLNAHGQPIILFEQDDGTASEQDMNEFLKDVSDSGARLLVLELLLPLDSHDCEPLTCKELPGILGGSVEAAVLTSLPVHLSQCELFNNTFYKALGEGDSIVAATQLARTALKNNKPHSDAAGFGWFAVITGPQSDIRLISQAPQAPTSHGSRQPQWRSSDV